MNINRIEDLLVRYEKGETNLEEEKELERVFAEESAVPDHLLHWRGYFRSLRTIRERNVQIPEGLEDRLSGFIDTLEEREGQKASSSSSRRIHLFRFAGSAAAVFLLAFSLWHQPGKDTPPTPKDTFDTPEEAQVEVERVLVAFAEAINEGRERMESVEEVSGDIQESLIRQLTLTNS